MPTLRWLRGAPALAVLIALAFGAPGCSTSLVPPRQGLAVHEVSFPVRGLQFPTGLRVVAERDERMPLVAIILVVGAGSTSDPLGKEGLAHYVEHLAFRSRPFGKSSFRRLLERAGAGEWNAMTGLDMTVYFELGPASALPELLRLEGARMLAPVAKLTPEVLATELEVVRNELRQRNETGYVSEVIGALQEAVFPSNHPYRRSVGGSHESVSSITPDEVAAFLKAHYRPDNMTLMLIGDVDLDGIEQLVQQSLPPELTTALAPTPPRPPLPAKAPEPPAPDPGSLVRIEGSVATPELWIGWSLPRSFDAGSFLVEFLEDSAADALAQAEREDQDLVGVTTSVMEGAQASMLMARATLKRGSNPERSMDRVLNRLHEIWALPGSTSRVRSAEDEFVQQKRSALVGALLGAEDIIDRGMTRATFTHFSNDPMIYSRALRTMATLERQQLTDYAQRYLSRERARAVLVTPRSGQSPVQGVPLSAPALDEEDPVPIRVDLDRLRSVAPAPGVRRFQQVTLDNGVEVIVGRRPGLPVATVGLLLNGGLGGAEDQAAAAAAMMLARPREQWHGKPTDFGGRTRRDLGADSVTYSLTGAAGNVGIMAAILAERVRSMNVDSGSWHWFERDYVPYLRFTDQKPEIVAARAFMARLLPGHSYGRSVTGKELGDSSVGAAQDWLDATHVARNAMLAIVGDIDEAQVVEIAREQFGGWSAGAVQPAPTAPMPGEAARRPALVTAHQPGATQAQLRFGCVLPPAEWSKDDVRHDVSAQVLESRLVQVLRQELGATYGVHVTAWVLRGGTAYLEVRSAVERSTLGPSLTALKGALASLAGAPVSANELSWAKLRLARGRSARYMTNRGVVSALLGRRNMGFPASSLDDFAEELLSVTAEAVQEDFRRCGGGSPTLSIVGDEGAATAAFEEVWK